MVIASRLASRSMATMRCKTCTMCSSVILISLTAYGMLVRESDDPAVVVYASVSRTGEG